MQSILKMFSIFLLITMLINAQPAHKEQILTANGGNVVAMDKEWAVVGDYLNNRVYVYKLNYSKIHNATMDMWELHTTLTTGGGARFGYSVAISGQYLVVGEPYKSNEKGKFYLYIYDAVTGVWSAANININGAVNGAHFGTSVAIASDGLNAKIAVGAPDFVVTGSATGRVRTFLWNGSLTEKNTLTDNTLHVRKFGTSLDMKGNRLIVGAPETVTQTPSDGAVGAAYTYNYNGTEWVPFPTAITHRIKPGIVNEHFGNKVAIDGNVSMISSSGKSYIYQVNGTTWNETYFKDFQAGGDVDINDGIYLMAQRATRLSFFSEIDGDTTVPRPLNLSRPAGSNAYTSVSLYKEQVMVNAPDSSQAVAIDVPCGIKHNRLKAFEWSMVSISCGNGTANIGDIFVDLLGTYGPNANWVMYEQNGSSWTGTFASMRQMDLNDTMKLGKGYWIIADADQLWQVNSSAVTTRTQLDVTTVTPSATIGGYYKATLPVTKTGEIKKIMVGNPFPRTFKWKDVKYIDASSTVFSPDQVAASYNTTAYVYDVSSQTGQPYRAITANGTPGFNSEIIAYQGFWIKEESASLDNQSYKIAIPFEK